MALTDAGLRDAFVSQVFSGANMEPANVVDVLANMSRNLRALAGAITPLDAAPAHDSHGGTVASLTEAVMGLGLSLDNIGHGLHDIADAIRGLPQ